MTSRLCAYILSRLLSEYVTELDPSKLNASILRGSIALSNLKCKTEFLEDTLTNMTPRLAVINKLALHIPWQSLHKSTSTVTVDGLLILMQLKSEIKLTNDVIEKRRASRRDQQLKHLESAEKQVSMLEEIEDEEVQEPKKKNWIQSTTEAIIRNIEIKVNNVHLRLEKLSGSLPFALGVTIDEISITSKKGRSSAKIGKILNLAVYMDTSFKPISLLSEEQAIDEMLRQIQREGGRDVVHKYIVKPFCLNMSIAIGGDGVEKPKYRISTKLPSIAFDLSTIQITCLVDQPKSLLGFGTQIDNTTTVYIYEAPRPNTMPHEDPADWWKYLIHSSRKKTYKTLSENTFVNYLFKANTRNVYMNTYRQYLALTKNETKDLPDTAQGRSVRQIMNEIEFCLPAEQIIIYRYYTKEEIAMTATSSPKSPEAPAPQKKGFFQSILPFFGTNQATDTSLSYKERLSLLEMSSSQERILNFIERVNKKNNETNKFALKVIINDIELRLLKDRPSLNAADFGVSTEVSKISSLKLSDIKTLIEMRNSKSVFNFSVGNIIGINNTVEGKTGGMINSSIFLQRMGAVDQGTFIGTGDINEVHEKQLLLFKATIKPNQQPVIVMEFQRLQIITTTTLFEIVNEVNRCMKKAYNAVDEKPQTLLENTIRKVPLYARSIESSIDKLIHFVIGSKLAEIDVVVKSPYVFIPNTIDSSLIFLDLGEIHFSSPGKPKGDEEAAQKLSQQLANETDLEFAGLDKELINSLYSTYKINVSRMNAFYGKNEEDIAHIIKNQAEGTSLSYEHIILQLPEMQINVQHSISPYLHYTLQGLPKTYVSLLTNEALKTISLNITTQNAKTIRFFISDVKSKLKILKDKTEIRGKTKTEKRDLKNIAGLTDAIEYPLESFTHNGATTKTVSTVIQLVIPNVVINLKHEENDSSNSKDVLHFIITNLNAKITTKLLASQITFDLAHMELLDMTRDEPLHIMNIPDVLAFSIDVTKPGHPDYPFKELINRETLDLGLHNSVPSFKSVYAKTNIVNLKVSRVGLGNIANFMKQLVDGQNKQTEPIKRIVSAESKFYYLLDMQDEEVLREYATYFQDSVVKKYLNSSRSCMNIRVDVDQVSASFSSNIPLFLVNINDLCVRVRLFPGIIFEGQKGGQNTFIRVNANQVNIRDMYQYTIHTEFVKVAAGEDVYDEAIQVPGSHTKFYDFDSPYFSPDVFLTPSHSCVSVCIGIISPYSPIFMGKRFHVAINIPAQIEATFMLRTTLSIVDLVLPPTTPLLWQREANAGNVEMKNFILEKLFPVCLNFQLTTGPATVLIPFSDVVPSGFLIDTAGVDASVKYYIRDRSDGYKYERATAEEIAMYNELDKFKFLVKYGKVNFASSVKEHPMAAHTVDFTPMFKLGLGFNNNTIRTPELHSSIIDTMCTGVSVFFEMALPVLTPKALENICKGLIEERTILFDIVGQTTGNCVTTGDNEAFNRSPVKLNLSKSQYKQFIALFLKYGNIQTSVKSNENPPVPVTRTRTDAMLEILKGEVVDRDVVFTEDMLTDELRNHPMANTRTGLIYTDRVGTVLIVRLARAVLNLYDDEPITSNVMPQMVENFFDIDEHQIESPLPTNYRYSKRIEVPTRGGQLKYLCTLMVHNISLKMEGKISIDKNFLVYADSVRIVDEDNLKILKISSSHKSREFPVHINDKFGDHEPKLGLFVNAKGFGCGGFHYKIYIDRAQYCVDLPLTTSIATFWFPPSLKNPVTGNYDDVGLPVTPDPTGIIWNNYGRYPTGLEVNITKMTIFTKHSNTINIICSGSFKFINNLVGPGATTKLHIRQVREHISNGITPTHPLCNAVELLNVSPILSANFTLTFVHNARRLIKPFTIKLDTETMSLKNVVENINTEQGVDELFFSSKKHVEINHIKILIASDEIISIIKSIAAAMPPKKEGEKPDKKYSLQRKYPPIVDDCCECYEVKENMSININCFDVVFQPISLKLNDTLILAHQTYGETKQTQYLSVSSTIDISQYSNLLNSTITLLAPLPLIFIVSREMDASVITRIVATFNKYIDIRPDPSIIYAIMYIMKQTAYIKQFITTGKVDNNEIVHVSEEDIKIVNNTCFNIEVISDGVPYHLNSKTVFNENEDIDNFCRIESNDGKLKIIFLEDEQNKLIVEPFSARATSKRARDTPTKRNSETTGSDVDLTTASSTSTNVLTENVRQNAQDIQKPQVSLISIPYIRNQPNISVDVPTHPKTNVEIFTTLDGIFIQPTYKILNDTPLTVNVIITKDTTTTSLLQHVLKGVHVRRGVLRPGDYISGKGGEQFILVKPELYDYDYSELKQVLDNTVLSSYPRKHVKSDDSEQSSTSNKDTIEDIFEYEYIETYKPVIHFKINKGKNFQYNINLCTKVTNTLMRTIRINFWHNIKRHMRELNRFVTSQDKNEKYRENILSCIKHAYETSYVMPSGVTIEVPDNSKFFVLVSNMDNKEDEQYLYVSNIIDPRVQNKVKLVPVCVGLLVQNEAYDVELNQESVEETDFDGSYLAKSTFEKVCPKCQMPEQECIRSHINEPTIQLDNTLPYDISIHASFILNNKTPYELLMYPIASDYGKLTYCIRDRTEFTEIEGDELFTFVCIPQEEYNLSAYKRYIKKRNLRSNAVNFKRAIKELIIPIAEFPEEAIEDTDELSYESTTQMSFTDDKLLHEKKKKVQQKQQLFQLTTINTEPLGINTDILAPLLVTVAPKYNVNNETNYILHCNLVILEEVSCNVPKESNSHYLEVERIKYTIVGSTDVPANTRMSVSNVFKKVFTEKVSLKEILDGSTEGLRAVFWLDNGHSTVPHVIEKESNNNMSCAVPFTEFKKSRLLVPLDDGWAPIGISCVEKGNVFVLTVSPEPPKGYCYTNSSNHDVLLSQSPYRTVTTISTLFNEKVYDHTHHILPVTCTRKRYFTPVRVKPGETVPIDVCDICIPLYICVRHGNRDEFIQFRKEVGTATTDDYDNLFEVRVAISNMFVGLENNRELIAQLFIDKVQMGLDVKTNTITKASSIEWAIDIGIVELYDNVNRILKLSMARNRCRFSTEEDKRVISNLYLSLQPVEISVTDSALSIYFFVQEGLQVSGQNKLRGVEYLQALNDRLGYSPIPQDAHEDGDNEYMYIVTNVSIAPFIVTISLNLSSALTYLSKIIKNSTLLTLVSALGNINKAKIILPDININTSKLDTSLRGVLAPVIDPFLSSLKLNLLNTFGVGGIITLQESIVDGLTQMVTQVLNRNAKGKEVIESVEEAFGGVAGGVSSLIETVIGAVVILLVATVTRNGRISSILQQREDNVKTARKSGRLALRNALLSIPRAFKWVPGIVRANFEADKSRYANVFLGGVVGSVRGLFSALLVLVIGILDILVFLMIATQASVIIKQEARRPVPDRND